MIPQRHSLNAGDPGVLQNFNVHSEINPVNIEDGAKAAMVKALEETDVDVFGLSGL